MKGISNLSVKMMATVTLIAVILLFVSPAISGVSLEWNVGVTSVSEETVTADPLPMICRVLDGPKSENIVWEEKHDARYRDGGYSITVGAGTETKAADDSSVLSGSDLWFELEIDGDVLYPRIPVDRLTQPFSLTGDRYRAEIALSASAASRATSEVSDGTLVLGNGGAGIGVDSPGGLLGFADENTHLDVDESMNLTFTDAVAGVKTLAELSAFNDWDKTTGILITESQITDLDHFTNGDETDPVFSAWDKSTGITVTESQITDLDHFTTGDETDPVFSAWDKSTGIAITESQISDLAHDNLGDHTATENVKLSGNWLSNDGGDEGVHVDDDGNVGVGVADPAELLELNNGNLLISQEDPGAVGHIDDGGDARGIYVSGSYAYLANDDDGLRIYDVTDPTTPANVGHINNGRFARGIYVSGSYAYLANDDDGLRIYDVADPATPVNVGHIDDGGDARGIYVSGSYAYLANLDDGLRIYDVADPATPVNVGHIDDGGYAFGIYVSGSYAYLANGGDGLRIYDVTDTAIPVNVGHIDNEGYAIGIYVSGSYAYLANLDDGLRIYDVTNPAAPVNVGHIDDGGQAIGIYVSGAYAYLANEYDGFRIYEVADPATPVNVGHIDDGGDAYGIYASGPHAYLANYSDGLHIYEISGVHAPSGYVGAFKSNNVDVSENLIVGADAYVKSGLSVGTNGFTCDGPVSMRDVMNLVPRETAPSSPSSGQLYFDDSEALCVYVNGTWANLAGTGTCE